MGRPLRVHDGETMVSFQPVSTKCLSCGHTARVAYHTEARGLPPCMVVFACL